MEHARKVMLGKKHNLRRPAKLLAPPLTVATLSLAAVMAVQAATYHDLSANTQPCSDCHTQHYSSGGAVPVQTPGSLPVTVQSGGPFARLLVQATTNKLCLFCHDGSNPSAPDVLDPVTMYDGSGDEHSGAGFFANSGGTAADKGHDLGVTVATVPFSSMTNVTITCASCHDPHGTPNYRSQLTAPAGGTGVSVLVGQDMFRDKPAGDPPSLAASILAYKRSNVGYKSNTSKWCVECHDGMKPLVGGTSRGTINHHLADFPINGLVGGLLKTDPAHWASGIGLGFGAITGDAVEGVPRLIFQVAGATDYPTSKAVATGNQVICTSCHLAHGSKYKKGLVWPYLESGSPADANSGCSQCHNI